MSLARRISRSNRNSPQPCPRFGFRAIWRGDHWALTSSDHYREFPTLEEALSFVRWLHRHGDKFHARFEERVGDDWKEITEQERREMPAIARSRKAEGRWQNWQESR